MAGSQGQGVKIEYAIVQGSDFRVLGFRVWVYRELREWGGGSGLGEDDLLKVDKLKYRDEQMAECLDVRTYN